MKKTILLVAVIFALFSCKKDPVNEALPAATQTGAGIFACKVNGQSFIDKSGGYFNCFYQLVNGEYYFGIQGGGRVNSLISVYLGTNQKQIFENAMYPLLEDVSGNVWGGSDFNQDNSQFFSQTNANNTGELTITKLDFNHKIVSGTFWFDIRNPYTNEIVEIREGRFDTIFTE